ncbi:hypothetical protein Pcinc_030779 [Petrolisthes cinctipes]|uniref:Uncharacterized protein n=1 Tax=Petrolisthes cinctipes TaxID=88211 RepID=A0AAE1EY02_PETCI|nr:hypothetical protein Pcinc_030779 [Petrolisthes cinctipes]
MSLSFIDVGTIVSTSRHTFKAGGPKGTKVLKNTASNFVSHMLQARVSGSCQHLCLNHVGTIGGDEAMSCGHVSSRSEEETSVVKLLAGGERPIPAV